MQTPAVSRQRVASIDLLRGAIMIIMALDHVRDYFHREAFFYDPLDLSQTSTATFLTRWITHFCAPIFMLLAGTSAFLSGQHKSRRQLSGFLLRRGIWLILLELVIMNFGWNFDPAYHTILIVTLWALGFSMMALSALVFLPGPAILLIGLLLVCSHNLLDGVHVPGDSASGFLWSLAHEPGLFHFAGRAFFVGYPVLSWIGVMALGYCLGSLYTPQFEPARRKRILLWIGTSAIASFIILRWINVYGDPLPWSMQKTAVFTILSFIDVTKYPPSLLYLLLTLGPAMLILAATERARGRIVDVISVYGRVPMFYYILHIYLIHLLAMIMSELFTNVDWSRWIITKPIWFDTAFRGYGFSLGVVYLLWLLVVVALYPLCRSYDRYKRAHKEKWWLSYL
jgi:uncharacterized membrane protein